MKKLGIFSALKLLWHISDKKEKAIFFTLLFSCLIRSFHTLLMPLATACVISKLSGKPASILFLNFPNDLSKTLVILIAFAIVFSFGIFSVIIRALTKLFSTKMMNKTNLKALEYILEYKKNFSLNMTNGEASYIVKNSSEQVAMLIEELLIKVLTPIITAIFAMAYIAMINIFAFLIVILTAILISLSIWYRIHYDKKFFKVFEKINGKINNHALNNIENLSFIGFFKTKFHEFEILKNLNTEYYKTEKKKVSTYTFYWIMIYVLQFTCTVSIVILIANNNNIDVVATLIVIIPYLLDIFKSVENLAYVIGNCQQYSIKISRLLLLKTQPENLILLSEHIKLPVEEVIEKITIKNMDIEIGNFSKTLNEISFYKGKINCLAGGSGSGKTSLLNCLLGLKEYKNGEIIINDKFNLKSLFFENERISLSFQDGNFFDRSLAEIVSYPDKEINPNTQQLIEFFELNDIFKRDFDNNETIKNTLSGGEKKRINFIRCISKNAEVYIFDEPTNELDKINVERVLEKINQLKSTALVIVVSHDARVMSLSENIINL